MTHPATHSGPVADDELDGLFAGLASYRLLVLAVSGGVDSMALMHLAKRWVSRSGGRPELRVATVDHALRETSRREAEDVGRAAGDLGLAHAILTWRSAKPASGVQAAARAARYELLAQHLAGLGEPNAALLTAHTADDQAETLLMRLARGSGLDGLAAMSERRPLLSGLPFDLCRPLLGTSKARLTATLQNAGIRWCEDPSNSRPEFERVRLRGAAEALANVGLTPDKLALSARRLARARLVVEREAAEFEARVLQSHGGAFATIDRDGFAAGDLELRLRMLSRVLTAFGGATPAPRMAEVEALVEKLERGSSFVATLGGCVVKAGRAVRVFREPGRLSQAEEAVRDVPLLWDRRFRVSVHERGSASDLLTVRPLGAAGYATLRRHDSSLPALAASTLPSFWSGPSLVAVPGVQANRDRPESCCRITVSGPSGGIFVTEFVGLPDEARNLR